MSQQWTDQKERSNRLALKLIRWIALHTSRPFARFWLYPITLYYLLTAPRARASSRHYARRVRDCQPGLRWTARQMFWFAATILDRVYFLTDKTRPFDIEINGGELLEEKLRRGGGCLLVGAHVGSTEVLRSVAINQMDLPLKILMYQAHNQMITEMLEALNPRVAGSVIDLADPNALLLAKEWLDQGGLVGMLGDRVRPGDRSISCEFFGAPAEFPPGPMRLAAALGVPVVLFVGLYRGANRYEIYFEELTEGISAPRGEREAQVERMVCRYVERLEYYLRLAPLNWFNFYDFWNDESGH